MIYTMCKIKRVVLSLNLTPRNEKSSENPRNPGLVSRISCLTNAKVPGGVRRCHWSTEWNGTVQGHHHNPFFMRFLCSIFWVKASNWVTRNLLLWVREIKSSFRQSFPRKQCFKKYGIDRRVNGPVCLGEGGGALWQYPRAGRDSHGG